MNPIMVPVFIRSHVRGFVTLFGEGFSCDGGRLRAGEPMRLRAGMSCIVRADAVLENDPSDTGKSRPLRSMSG